MRTSLSEIRIIEQYISGKLATEETLLVEAKLLINPILRLNEVIQRKIYSLVQAYHRKQLKKEINKIQNRLFSDPTKKAFCTAVLKHFNQQI